MSKRSILIVDDESNIRRILEVAFDKAGYSTFKAERASVALEILQEQTIDVVLSDVTMPGLSGYELQREVKQRYADIPVVLMTAYGTIPQAVQAIRDGAYEYVTKPFDLESLKRIVSAAIIDAKKAHHERKTAKLVSDAFIAVSPGMVEVRDLVAQVADTKATVLLLGESGVGKEVVARALHSLSSRSSKPFVATSCAAIPETLMEAELFGYEKGAFTGATGAREGRFEAANGGTIFLDEIGEVPLPIQVKLLRVLQEREIERLGSSKPIPIDARVVCATNKDLDNAVETGEFRLDLMYRLKVVEILIPPLRERRQDIVPLARLFLEKFGAQHGRQPLELTKGVVDLLAAYPWPGNVRELENTMERATVLAGVGQTTVNPKWIPHHLRPAA